MPELNASIRHIPLPARLAHRPVNERGFPVPWFVSWIDGTWEFVNVDPRKIGEAYRKKICWLCGEPLGRYFAFTIGPMCSINRVSSEPPAHRECSRYAVRVCPFLAKPNAKRNEKAHLGSAEDIPGNAVEHNPGATLIWITRSFKPFWAGNGNLFELGEPVEVAWYVEGRAATRAEIDAAIAKGLPLLWKEATAECQEAVYALGCALARADKLLPAG
jgi:hypothetical protein